MGYGPNFTKVCQEYIDTKLPMYLASNSITVVITLINLVIREVTVKLIKRIGYDTHSQLMTEITNGVFAAQFFNTGILILLVYANLTEHGINMF